MKYLAVLLVILMCSSLLLPPLTVNAERPEVPRRLLMLERAIDTLTSRLTKIAEKLDATETLEKRTGLQAAIREFKKLIAEGSYEEAWELGRQILAELGSMLKALYAKHHELRAKLQERLGNLTEHALARREEALLRAIETAAKKSNASSIIPMLIQARNCIREGNYSGARRLMIQCLHEIKRSAANNTAKRAVQATERMFKALNATIKVNPIRGINNSIVKIEAAIERLEAVAAHLEAVNASPVAIAAIRAAIAHLTAVKEHLEAVSELVEAGMLGVKLPLKVITRVDKLAEDIVEDIEELLEEASEKNIEIPEELIEDYHELKLELQSALEKQDIVEVRLLVRDLARIRAQVYRLVMKAKYLGELSEEAEELAESVEELTEEAKSKGKRAPVDVEELRKAIEEAKSRGDLKKLRELMEELKEARQELESSLGEHRGAGHKGRHVHGP